MKKSGHKISKPNATGERDGEMQDYFKGLTLRYTDRILHVRLEDTGGQESKFMKMKMGS